MRTLPVLLLMLCALSGCTSIKVQALNANGTSKTGAAEGIRYYLPRPYLLVTELPAADSGHSPKSEEPPTPVDVPPPPPKVGHRPAKNFGFGLAGGADDAPKKDAAPSDKKPDDGATTTPGSGSDASYQHLFNGYQVKLVYLPDLSQPMAISIHAGFGSVSVQPTLVDGWMLTSLQGTADSKVSETISSIASLVSAAKGGGKSAASDNKAGGADTKDSTTAIANVLHPGLYKFDYDSGGQLTNFCAVAFFGTEPTTTPVAKCPAAKYTQ